MEPKNTDKIKLSHFPYINELSHDAAIKILIELCKDNVLAKRIKKMAKEFLSHIDVEAIADEVFDSLNSIDVEELWENSGKTRWGYQEPTEVAYDMLSAVIDDFIMDMNKYRRLGMKTQEKEFCKGIISGLLRYGQDGNNEFRDWAPDDPYTLADNVIYEWKGYYGQEAADELQEFHDSFYANDEDEEVMDNDFS
jgi:hypothetical protein